MRHRLVIVTAASLAACSSAPPERLVFADEFTTEGPPDPTKWDHELGRIRNGELQHYTRELRNARVENGLLVVEAHRENVAGATFTAASVITKGKAAFTTARVEVRARLPRGRGVWPAIWLLGTNMDTVGWPRCGEIDVMEFVGFEPGVVHCNVHSHTYNHMHGNGRGTRLPLPSASDAFHVYGVQWDRQCMVFTLDGAPTFTVGNDGTGVDSWPFDQPFYLLLNFAVGGSWGGQQGVDETVFPQRLEIDWVRVWSRAAP
jgi:beta-glucanase (GH16 family)